MRNPVKVFLTTTYFFQLDNYIIIDVGANLTNKKFGRDLDQVIQRAKDAGISKIMVTGTSIQASKDALRLSRLYPGTLYATAGIHPHDAKSWNEDEDDTLSLLKGNIENFRYGCKCFPVSMSMLKSEEEQSFECHQLLLHYVISLWLAIFGKTNLVKSNKV